MRPAPIRQLLERRSVPLSVPACVLARVGFVCAARIVGASLVADGKFLIAPLQAHREERVGRPGWSLGKKPLGCRQRVRQGLRRRRRRDLGLRREHAQAQGARHGASEQEKALHRDCPHRSAAEGYHARDDGRHSRFDAVGRPQLRRLGEPATVRRAGQAAAPPSTSRRSTPTRLSSRASALAPARPVVPPSSVKVAIDD